MSFGKKGPYKGKTISQAFGGVSTSAIKGRNEKNLKQADPDSSDKKETYPFVGKQSGPGRKNINDQKSGVSSFVPAPRHKVGKGNARNLSKFFGTPVTQPRKIATSFAKGASVQAPPNKGFSATQKGKAVVDSGFGEKKQAPRKVAKSFAG